MTFFCFVLYVYVFFFFIPLQKGNSHLMVPSFFYLVQMCYPQELCCQLNKIIFCAVACSTYRPIISSHFCSPLILSCWIYLCFGKEYMCTWFTCYRRNSLRDHIKYILKIGFDLRSFFNLISEVWKLTTEAGMKYYKICWNWELIFQFHCLPR